MRVALLVTEDWYLCSHRLPVVRAAVAAGHEVLVLTNVVDHAEPILATDAGLVPIPLVRNSANPLVELKAVWSIVRTLRRFRPDVVHNVALKPILYGTFGARIAGARLVVNALAGLGDLFMREDRGLARRVLRLAVARSLRGKRTRVLVQNPEDAAIVEELGVDPSRIDMIRGSGVALDEFVASPPPDVSPIEVLFVGRLLESKGLHELHEAAVQLRASGLPIEISVAGDRDPHNPGCIDEATLSSWAADGAMRMLGRRDDVAELLRRAHLVVLPSYREGVPKSLLEGAAAGRPLIATDVPGNREVVRHGDNGLLIPVRDPGALAAAIEELAGDPERRIAMGHASRTLAEAEFSDDAVARATLAIYEHSGVG